MVDELVRGLINTPMETLDNFLTKEITNHLFEDSAVPFSGLDLAALNIQRGREHGLRSYNDYRAVCNLRRARSFNDLSREIKPELIEKLQRVSLHDSGDYGWKYCDYGSSSSAWTCINKCRILHVTRAS